MGSLLEGNPEEPTETPNDTAVETPNEPSSDINFPENWKEAVPEDLREDPSLKAINDIPGLVKSYVNAQRMIGADKIVVPNKYDDGTQLREALTKLGLPQDSSQYEVKKSEEIEIDDELFNSYKSKAHELGILPQQAEQFINHVVGEYSNTNQAEIEKYNTQILEEQKNLKEEWGAGYDSQIDLARKAAQHLADGDKETLEHLMNPNFSGDPKNVRILNKIGQMLKEDILISDAKGSWGKTPEDAQKEYNNIMGDSKHPYNNVSHPDHERAVKEVSKLFQMMG